MLKLCPPHVFPILALPALLWASGCGWQADRAPERVPIMDVNVLLITIDTLRPDYLGCYGKEDIATPVIDRLCREGVRFEQAISQYPLTPPSHASILTGVNPPTHKIRDMGGFRLDPKIPKLAEVLRRAGFDTAAVVAAAVLHRTYGLDRGFDLYRDDMAANSQQVRLPGVVAEIPADEVSRRAREWLAGGRTSDRPFLLWVHYYDPHFPYDAPEPYRTRYAGDPYAGEVAYTDEQIGELLAFLEENGQRERTLVVLLSDHGESLGEHGEETHGVFLYDSTARIPLIMAGPGVPRAGSVARQVRSIDVMPTILELLNFEQPPGLEGVSLVAAMQGEAPAENGYTYLETFYTRSQMGWSELRALRTDQWKLILAPRPELYRLETDPHETENIFERYPQEAARLQEQLWEVAGPPSSWRLPQPEPVDPEILRRLQALGYLAGGIRQSLPAESPAPDPKDRVFVLQGLERATALMNRDRFSAAVTILEELLREDPGNPTIYGQMGLSLQRLGRWDRAAKVYLEAIGRGAGNRQTYAELGKIFIRTGNLEEAAAWMEQGVEANPADVDNMANLATAYLELGRLHDSERMVEMILTQNPAHAGAHNVMGMIEVHRGRGAQARRHFEAAVAENPKLAEPYMNLGILAQEAGRPDAALNYFRLFLETAQGPQYREIIPRVRAAIADLESELKR